MASDGPLHSLSPFPELSARPAPFPNNVLRGYNAVVSRPSPGIQIMVEICISPTSSVSQTNDNQNIQLFGVCNFYRQGVKEGSLAVKGLTQCASQSYRQSSICRQPFMLSANNIFFSPIKHRLTICRPKDHIALIGERLIKQK